uniref:Uncharacterized mitochondrial protein AtMg00810-like n=1 Tax=Nicotiana tabacum TaxID=4097 RepID=A0A1S4CNP4_TOBAC|nr:PREDICTED: uncharacterized mitochondrial protein AtMg00810-like [Nicotiana tabacum]
MVQLRDKARLVIKGDSQKKGTNYFETFTPVVKIITVKCLLTLAVKHGWVVHQLDANNAFLHGDLHEEVYMKIPLGLTVGPSSSDPHLACKLKKFLYGLKQASRQWCAKLSQSLLSRGYSPSKNDSALFTKITVSSIVILVVYVADILLAGDNGQEIAHLKAFLDQQFKIKDLGSIHYFLGLEVSLVECGYVVHQHKYTTDLLSEFHCLDTKPVTTPLDPQNKLHIDSGDPISDPSTYKSLIGKLNFFQHTRPNISFSVQHLSQFLVSPKVPHMLDALHVLRYLANDPTRGILLSSSSDFTLKAYSDSDWAACPISRRSVTGYFVLGDSPVSWKSKKHPTVSLSFDEAEYRALRQVVAEVSWLLRLLANMDLSITSPISIFCDSQATMHIARNPVFHKRTKHI